MNSAVHKREVSLEGDFAHYKILRSLEEDRVFLVASLIDGSISALKIANREGLEDSTFNLKREFVMHANFQHANILNLGEALEDDSRFGFTTSYVGGGDLRERISEIKKPQIPALLRDIAMGLAHIHEKGFVHADVKPENILISTKGSPVICDFGLARDLKAKRVDSSSTLMGTAKYMSPEYLIEGHIGTFTDIYALGLMAIELFSGSTPGEDLDVIDMLKGKIRPYDKNVYEQVPDGLRELIMSSLEIDPKNRVQNGAEFVGSINSYIEKARTEEDSLVKHVRLRVLSDIRPMRLRKKTEPIRPSQRAA